MKLRIAFAFGSLLALVLTSACAVSITRMSHPTKGDADWRHDTDDCNRRADRERAHDHDGYVKDCLHSEGWR